MMKKAFSVFSILILTFGLFMSGYAVKYPAYASINDDTVWTPLRQRSDMVIAFQEYCKSRDLTIEGSVADGVTTFTTGAFNSICNTLGINMTQLQAEIKAEYDTYGKPLKFLFTGVGIDAYNRIFAQFLQDNEIEVGDVVDKTVYSGMQFTDLAGNKCLCYVLNSENKTQNNVLMNYLVYQGTTYLFDGYDLWNIYGSSTSGVTSYTFDNNFYKNDESSIASTLIYVRNPSNPSSSTNYQYVRVGQNNSGSIYFKDNGSVTQDGNLCIIYDAWKDHYYYGYTYYDHTVSSNNRTIKFYSVDYTNNHWIELEHDGQNIQINNVTIVLNTNYKTINNNNYEGDTIINNYPDDDPDPNPDIPDYPDPDYPEPPPYDPDYPDDPIEPQTPPNDWGIELPDFTDFDWIMSGLEKKFPWDIPFNIMFMLSLFVAEPQAPHFVGDIDLKVTNWHYDLDLAPFEPLADIFRKFFFIGFLLGLMLLTKQLIWG